MYLFLTSSANVTLFLYSIAILVIKSRNNKFNFDIQQILFMKINLNSFVGYFYSYQLI